MTRTIVVYGNCQAEYLIPVLKHIPGLRSVPILYFSSFERAAGNEAIEATEAQIADCLLLLAHTDDPKRPFPRSLLPDDATIVTFSPLDFNALWPWTMWNPFDLRDTANPWGSFPYGDRIIVDCIEKGMPPGEILDYYLNEAWQEYAPKLDRLLEMETRRLTARDAACDVKMGELILASFRTHRLFWTRNHPVKLLLSELLGRMISIAARDFPAFSNLDIPAFLAMHAPEPFAAMQVPIHPRVAEHFDLRWYDPESRYAWPGHLYTYREYFAEMIRHAAAARRLADVP